MWLEDSCNLLVLIQITNGFHTLCYFGRMMGIVVDQDDIFFLEMEVETTARTGKGRHTMLDLLRCHTVQPGGDADIRTDKVEEDFATSDADVLRIKVGTSS